MEQHPKYQHCKDRVSRKFGQGESPDNIREEYGDFYEPDLLEYVIGVVARELSTVIQWGDPTTLDGRNIRYNWYKGPTSSSTRWNYFISTLAQQGHIGEETLEKLNASTNRILNLNPPPDRKSFASRGLVMGHVQSGKTTNFLGLAAKAADEKYRLIIVLSGITNSLRDQTQERLESTLVDPNGGDWYLLTSRGQDFRANTNGQNAQILLQQGSNRLIAVVKKNKARLNSLYRWLSRVQQTTRDTLPVMIIDDECDQATPNSGTGDNRTAINQALARLMDPAFLRKVSYVGYSATPFANILADSTDTVGIYPRDFIVSLDKSPGYFGAKELFGTDTYDSTEDSSSGVDIIRNIPNADVAQVRPPRNSADVDSWTPVIPDSLKTAINWFIISTAARSVRGQADKWSSMMVHTSSNIKPHNKTAEEIRRYISSLTAQDNDGVWLENLRDLWEQESPKAKHLEPEMETSWAQISLKIAEVVRAIQVIIDNSKSSDRLNYAPGQHPAPVLVVGGNTLSRGLTLEGLVSSYFLRSSNAYDSLMQMGRWFGYRPGYSDLQRIWLSNETPYETKKWFQELAQVEDEIREQIALYSLEMRNPLEVGVRIKSLPGMAITAAAKMSSAIQAQIGYGATRQQTILFSSDKASIEGNQKALARLAQRVVATSAFEDNGEGWPLAKGIPAEQVLDFISDYTFHENSRTLSRSLLTEYISRMNKESSLQSWNFAIYSNSVPSAPVYEITPGVSVRKANRSKVKGDPNLNIKSLISLGDMVADQPRLKVLAKTKTGKISEAALHLERSVNPSTQGIPLLGIYIIDADSKPAKMDSETRENLAAEGDLVGLFFVFPESSSPTNATYYATNLSAIEADFEDIDDPYSEDEDDDNA